MHLLVFQVAHVCDKQASRVLVLLKSQGGLVPRMTLNVWRLIGRSHLVRSTRSTSGRHQESAIPPSTFVAGHSLPSNTKRLFYLSPTPHLLHSYTRSKANDTAPQLLSAKVDYTPPR